MRLPLLIAFRLASLAVPAHAASAEAAPPGVAVVELFTSEGCSSCPAADDVLAAEAAAGRAGVLLLAYHVDYWDRLGWKDPYASAAASDRQYAYAKAICSGRVYTPQALVNGHVDVIGSDAPALQAAITRELARPASARVELITAWAGRGCTATCAVAALTAKAPAPTALTVALVEDALSDVVTRGENAGRTLTHQRVVRESRSVPLAKTLAPLAFALPEGAVAERMRVIAYAQDAKRVVVGAAESAWSAPAQAPAPEAKRQTP